KEKESKEKQAALDRRAKEEAVAEKTRATLAEINQKVREARPLLAEASRRQTLPPAASKLRKDLEAVVAQAQRARPATPIADLEKLRDRLGVSAASLKTALGEAPVAATTTEGKPPAALVEAAAAFFKGDYAVAARALETADFPDPRANAQARL